MKFTVPRCTNGKTLKIADVGRRQMGRQGEEFLFFDFDFVFVFFLLFVFFFIAVRDRIGPRVEKRTR